MLEEAAEMLKEFAGCLKVFRDQGPQISGGPEHTPHFGL